MYLLCPFSPSLHAIYFYANRYIVEMTESSKLLEDQLNLMDNKYLDMRQKLDYAREQNKLESVRAERKANELRRKYSALTGNTRMLDSVPMPNTFDTAGRGVSWADFPESPGGTGAGNNKFGISTNRARSAPSHRPSTGSKGKMNESFKRGEAEPTIDMVLAKIEKKKRVAEGSWDPKRAYELVAEAEAAQPGGRPRPRGSTAESHKKQPPRPEEPVDVPVYSIPSSESYAQSEVSVPTPTNVEAHVPHRTCSFSILGMKNKKYSDDDDL